MADSITKLILLIDTIKRIQHNIMLNSLKNGSYLNEINSLILINESDKSLTKYKNKHQ